MEIFVLISLLFVFSMLCGAYAHTLDRGFLGYFLLSMVLSPIIVFILLLIIGKKNTENIVVVEQKVTTTNIDELMKLGELLEKGLISKEEFETQKAKLL